MSSYERKKWTAEVVWKEGNGGSDFLNWAKSGLGLNGVWSREKTHGDTSSTLFLAPKGYRKNHSPKDVESTTREEEVGERNLKY